ncbi:MAG: DEAD/DEAH box helicase [Corynebacterium glucuronolyticum]|nr:DEAD/DEAH box helicase [Corynebacterium glucuronolyticum]
MKYTANELAQKVGGFAPTPQQQAVIEYPMNNLLVVAGAGAGKTKTMADRVVWLVANGLVRPEQVLGLTFTRKAAQNLKQKIRSSLFDLHQKVEGAEVRAEENLDASVFTYDAYAQNLVREYGLLLPTEPGSRIISTAEMIQIATDIVEDFHGSFPDETASKSTSTVASKIVSLVSAIESNMLTADDVRHATAEALRVVDDIERATKDTTKFIATQDTRVILLGLVDKFNQYLKDNRLTTFSHTMAAAARLASGEPSVGNSERHRYRVVMLDEYQDTSHSQRIFLRSLFGTGEPGLAVTAVGDPMQAIYGWRGASSSNLANFVTDFPHTAETNPDGTPVRPAQKLELTTSFRNPCDVLGVANTISGAILEATGEYAPKERTVAELEPRPGAGDGEVLLANFELEEEEADFVARQLATEYHGVADADLDSFVASISSSSQVTRSSTAAPFEAAILVRQHNQVPEAVKALEKYKVPYHVHSLAGLLMMPEIVDLVSIAKALARPEDSSALLRILTGPLVKLGFADLKALSNRARTLNSYQRARKEDQEEASLTADAEYDDVQPTEALSSHPALERLKKEVEDALAEDAVSLGDALADLGDAGQYTAEGYARLSTLASRFRWLRGHSLASGLRDIFQDIENTFGIRTEVLARENPRQLGVPGTSHLDTFHGYVSDYASIDGATLRGFLEYLDAEAEDRAMDQGEQTVSPNRVDIMTVHAAKGLEFATVAVIGANSKMYKDGQQTITTETAASRPETLPSAIVGDSVDVPEPLLGKTAKEWKTEGYNAYEYAFLDSTPRYAVSPDLEITKGSHFKESVDRYKYFLRMKEVRESTRLFYVAVTRSSQKLIITAHGRVRNDFKTMTFQPNAEADGEDSPKKRKPRTPTAITPTELFDRVANSDEFANNVVTWWEPGEELEELYVERDAEAARFPADFLGEKRDAIERAAVLVKQQMDELASQEQDSVQNFGNDIASADAEASDAAENPERDADPEKQRIARWDLTARKLIEEKRLAERSEIEVELGNRINATEIVQLKKNPEELAKRRLRPVPFKPNSQAKRGTKFHQWIEDHYKLPTLLDDDQLPGIGEEDVTAEELATLKENFLASPWAERTPVAVEQAIEYQIGSKRVTGKIDAVFKNPDGTWTVVDWKTGKVPTKRDLPALSLQLAEYRLAWAEIQSKREGRHIDPAEVEAVFFYVREGYTLKPETLMDKEEIRCLIELEGTQQ